MALGIPPVMAHVASSWITQAMYVAAKLGVAEVLHDGPLAPAALAAKVGAHPQATHRLLRMLASGGVFEEQPDGTFANNPASETLRRGVPGSIYGTMISMIELGWRAWGDLLASVQTGEPAFARVHGKSRYEVLDEDPALSALFEEAIGHAARASATAITAAYDFSRFARIVDIGGGDGTLLAAILNATPGAAGVVFERPNVIPHAVAKLDASGVGARSECVGGDFFVDDIPRGDALLLKAVLHNWDDVRAVAILERCRAALPVDGRLFVLEALIAPGNAPDFHKLTDMHMLVMHGGRERTRDEYERLFARAGLRLAAVTELPTLAIMEVAHA